jgi:hypothetical protein
MTDGTANAIHVIQTEVAIIATLGLEAMPRVISTPKVPKSLRHQQSRPIRKLNIFR